MSTTHYLSELQRRLKHLSPTEREDVLAFYAEYASEAGLDSYEALALRFGPPRKLAAAIYAETAEKTLETSGSAARGAWIGLAALAAFPFSFSAAAVLGSLALALVLTVGSLLLSLGVSALALAAAGIWSLLQIGPALYPFQAGPFLTSLGGFLLLTPGGVLLLVLWGLLGKKLLKTLSTSITTYIQRRTTHEA